MLRTSAHTLLGASALALSACTIYTNPRPATYQASRAVAQPAAVRTAPIARGPALGVRTAATPTVSSTPNTQITPVTPGTGFTTIDVPTRGFGIRAPRVTSPTIFGSGQLGAFVGEAYVIPAGTLRLPNLSDSIPFATLFTNSFEVKTQAFAGGFPGALRQDDWFALRYEGDFIIEGDGLAEFALTSDDGAVLTIDGQLLIDNGSSHTTSTTSAKREMTRGQHHIRLDYFQGAKGQVALSLDVMERGQKSPFAGLRPLQGLNRAAGR
jgi:PA14 domain-containing protein